MCTATEVQTPNNRQQPDNESRDIAAAEIAILGLIRDLLGNASQGGKSANALSGN